MGKAIQGGMPEFLLSRDVVFSCRLSGASVAGGMDGAVHCSPGDRRLVFSCA